MASDNQTTKPGLRVLVCGGRDYSKAAVVIGVMDRLAASGRVDEVITGGAPGADYLAAGWAADRDIPVWEFRADWDGAGRAAGPQRNQRMLDEAKPHMVIAFPGGRGTADMVQRAEAAHVPVARITPAVLRIIGVQSNG